jgi:4'-phosphopantetheinyl transferase
VPVRSPPTPIWQLPPPGLSLSPGDVHVWRSPLSLTDDQRDRFWQTLSPDERSRAERYRFPQHRQRAIAARGILREILGQYLTQDPACLQFDYTPHGKPALVLSPGLPTLEFNLSHAQDLMLCAVTLDHPVGIDLEQIHPVADLAQLTQRFFAPSEHQTIQALPHDQQSAAFFQHWTVKEAILKAIAQGLGGLETVEMTFAQGQPQLIQAPEVENIWDVRSFIPEPEFMGAIATTGALPQHHFWQFCSKPRSFASAADR